MMQQIRILVDRIVWDTDAQGSRSVIQKKAENHARLQRINIGPEPDKVEIVNEGQYALEWYSR